MTSGDFPELMTFGENEAEAIVHAADALEVMMAQYLRVGCPYRHRLLLGEGQLLSFGCRRPLSDSPGGLR